MTKPGFKWEFNLGHLLTAGTLIAAMAVAWGNLNSRTMTHEEALVQDRLEKAAIEARLRAVEAKAERADERTSNILTLLSRIDQRLDRMERRDLK